MSGDRSIALEILTLRDHPSAGTASSRPVAAAAFAIPDRATPLFAAHFFPAHCSGVRFHRHPQATR
jgi:hypothetical protein